MPIGRSSPRRWKPAGRGRPRRGCGYRNKARSRGASTHETKEAPLPRENVTERCDEKAKPPCPTAVGDTCRKCVRIVAAGNPACLVFAPYGPREPPPPTA